MKKLNCCAVIIVLLILFSFQPLRANDLLITNARLIDATGAAPRDGVSILIRDGLIVAIGDDATADDVQGLDVQGATVLPGLIDSHMHFMWGPGSFLRTCTWYDGKGSIDLDCWRRSAGKNILHYFRAYLACGVTTVLDAAAPGAVLEEIRVLLNQSGTPAPRFLPLGPFGAPPGGYGSGQAPTISTADDVKAHFDLLETLKTAGAKTSIESGWGHSPEGAAPIFSETLRLAFRDEALLRHKPVFIHTTSEADMRLALEMEPRALMHTILCREETLSDDFIALMAASDTYQVTTLFPMDAELTFWLTQRLDDPLLELVAPPDELAHAKNYFIRRAAQWSFFKAVPLWIRGYVVRKAYTYELYSAYLEDSMDAIRRLHAAGVSIVAGSDAAYGDQALYAFHGYATLREIELIGQAGLTPMEAIQTATINAA